MYIYNAIEGEMKMYPEYEKINAFIARASKLLETNRTMKDIFDFTMDLNSKELAVEFKDDDLKFRKMKYKQLKLEVVKFAKVIAQKLANEEKNRPVVLKAKNSPYWIMAFYAILMAGFKPLLVAAQTPAEATTNLARQAKAVAVVTDDLFNYELPKITIFDLRRGVENSSFVPSWENEVIF